MVATAPAAPTRASALRWIVAAAVLATIALAGWLELWRVTRPINDPVTGLSVDLGPDAGKLKAPKCGGLDKFLKNLQVKEKAYTLDTLHAQIHYTPLHAGSRPITHGVAEHGARTKGGP